MSKKTIDPNAFKALTELRYEIANELALRENLLTNKSGPNSGENLFHAGYVGGHMTKKLVETGEKSLVNNKHI